MSKNSGTAQQMDSYHRGAFDALTAAEQTLVEAGFAVAALHVAALREALGGGE